VRRINEPFSSGLALIGMSKVAAFPHRYTVRLTGGQVEASPRAPILAGPPPQFGGTDTVWSPEDLLVAAVLECLWTTFNAYSRRDGLTPRHFSGTGTAVLERGTQAAPVPSFSSITLHVDLVVAPGDEERGLRLLHTAEQNCIISNALRVPVTLEATVTAAQDETLSSGSPS
jgi:organic hydroperoxide reductase OsmC/OhrA